MLKEYLLRFGSLGPDLRKDIARNILAKAEAYWRCLQFDDASLWYALFDQLTDVLDVDQNFRLIIQRFFIVIVRLIL